MSRPLKLKWFGKGFGEHLILAWVVRVLNDNGIPAVLNDRSTIHGLVDCPMIGPMYPDEGISFKIVSGRYTLDQGPLHQQYIKLFETMCSKKLEISLNYIPVTFKELPEIPEIDVVMCTKTGEWTPYRNWPYFDELKNLLDSAGISHFDLNANRCYGNECLNYVQKCRLYLGLETGTSHYVSKFANGKALIIQSGFSYPEFWASIYNYEFVEHPVECSPCFINKRDVAKGGGCRFEHRCMTEISPETVCDRVIKMLRGDQ